MSTRKNIAKFGCLPIAVLVGIALALSGGEDDTTTSSDAKPPAYNVVQHDKTGNQRQIVIEVDTTDSLRAVFDAVTGQLDDDAGYYVQINCSTGGTKTMDNRLANGRYAVGRLGAATTGLNEGDTEFSTNPDRTCPDKAPKPDPDAAREAAGLPTEPSPAARQAYLDALDAIDPRIIKPGKADQAVSRGINQCGSVKSFPDDEEKLAELALERFTITTRLPEIATMDTGKKVVAAVREHICPDF